jgi:phenylacetate-CoA ligase
MQALRAGPQLRRVREEHRSWLRGDLDGGDPKARIVDALPDLARAVEAYRGLEGTRDFDRIPLMGKDDVRSAPLRYVPRAARVQELACKPTSGTTGPPVRFFFDLRWHLTDLFTAVLAVLDAAGLCAGGRSVLCLHVTDTQRSPPGQVFKPPDGLGGLSVRAVIDQSRPDVWEAVRDWIEFLDPAVISSRPEILTAMALAPPVAGATPASRPVAVVSSGSELDDSRRELIAERLGAPVVGAYGLSEFGVVASECRTCGSLHLADRFLVAEVVDDDGHPVPAGEEGELVLSSVVNEAMPLLRYRTGDRVALSDVSCGAHPGRVIDRVVGRRVPVFRFSDQSVLTPTHFTDLHDRFPIRDYQLSQLALERIELLFEPLPGADADEVAAGLERHLAAVVRRRARLEVRACSFGLEKIARFRSML